MIIQSNVPLSSHCTLKIGGKARYYIEVTTTDEIREAFIFANRQKLPIVLLGKGSNILFSDTDYEGVVIHNKIAFIKQLDDQTFSVGAGTGFPLLGIKTAKLGLTGLEFAAGVPGSVGGAIFMNAGAFNQETVDTLEQVTFMTSEGEIITTSIKKDNFGYRISPFQKKEAIILKAIFKLQKDPTARERQLKYLKQRETTQPLTSASAGCIFKNPERHSAGALIEQSGLKGYQMGGIYISPKHANYFINEGSGTAKDVQDLIDHTRNVVKTCTGIVLEQELKTEISFHRYTS